MKQLRGMFLSLALVAVCAVSMAVDYRSLNVMYFGDTYTSLKDGTAYTVNSSTLDAQPIYPVSGITAGYKVARGVTAVTGSSTIVTATHGLASVVSITANLGVDASIDANDVTTAISGTSIVLKVWKPTSTANPTPIAATVAKNVYWIAVGT